MYQNDSKLLNSSKIFSICVSVWGFNRMFEAFKIYNPKYQSYWYKSSIPKEGIYQPKYTNFTIIISKDAFKLFSLTKTHTSIFTFNKKFTDDGKCSLVLFSKIVWPGAIFQWSQFFIIGTDPGFSVLRFPIFGYDSPYYFDRIPHILPPSAREVRLFWPTPLKLGGLWQL